MEDHDHISSEASAPATAEAPTDSWAVTRSPETLPPATDPPSNLDFSPVAIAFREAGWTPERQRAFIEELADCGVVREAAARVGMAEQSAYRLRRRPDAAGFNRAWDAAVQLGIDRLHSTAVERALTGAVRKRYWEGQVVGEDRVFDNRLLVYLLNRLDAKRSYDVRHTIENWEGSMGALEDGLDKPLPEPELEPEEGGRAPVWQDEEVGWVTNLAPPEGFAGEQWGNFGEEEYCRQLAPDELAAVDAWQARLDAANELRRERYFARLGEKS